MFPNDQNIILKKNSPDEFLLSGKFLQVDLSGTDLNQYPEMREISRVFEVVLRM